MVKLTPDLIEQSFQFTNPVRDRELDLRGNINLSPGPFYFPIFPILSKKTCWFLTRILYCIISQVILYENVLTVFLS